MLAAWTEGTWHSAPESGHVRTSGCNYDTRKLKPQEAFVALRISRRDGHAYLQDAQAAGAAIALVEQVNDAVSIPQLQVKDSFQALQAIATEHRLRFPGKLIGITGSCGKTSTKDILTRFLGETVALKTPANENNALGVPITLTHIDHRQHPFAVIEAGINDVEEMAGLARMIQPDIAMFTTIAPTHLEKLRSLENIAHEKTQLALHGKGLEGMVIFPSECLRYRSFQRLSERAFILCPKGRRPKCHAAQAFIDYQTRLEAADGCRLEMSSATFGEQVYRLPQLSPGMLSNVCLAIIAANQCGVSAERIQQVVANWQPSSMRGEIQRVGDKVFYIDCYNASPASMVDAFAAFAQAMDPALPRLYVLGCMEELGVESNELHFTTGLKLKLRKQDRAIIIGNHATAFCEGIIAAGHSVEQVSLLSTLHEVQQAIGTFAGAVLLKGSRRYELEKLARNDLQPPDTENTACSHF